MSTEEGAADSLVLASSVAHPAVAHEPAVVTKSAVSLPSVSKFRYFLEGQSACQRVSDQVEFFSDQNELLSELHVIFDWLAQKPGATTISRGRFKERAPEFFRKFPQLASSFGRLDEKGRGCVDRHEFLKFCLGSPWLKATTLRFEAITVFGRDACGNRICKEASDPALMCEMQCCPPLLPWEVSHIVEWRLRNLRSHVMWASPKVGELPWTPGKHIDSPPFAAAGVSGFLRFWPAGQFTQTQQNVRNFPNLRYCPHMDDSHQPAPGARGCCVGLFMPPGTHLKLRFFVGKSWSKVREVCWSGGTHVGQVWAPLHDAPPSLADGEQLVVGAEICKNFAMPRKPRPRHLNAATKASIKPPMQEFAVTGVLNGVCQIKRSAPVPGLGKAQSLPNLPSLPPQLVEDGSRQQKSVLSKSVSLPRLSVSLSPGFSTNERLLMDALT